jgi:hypothetical protein
MDGIQRKIKNKAYGKRKYRFNKISIMDSLSR